MIYSADFFEGKKTECELVPSISFFTENREKELKQDPLMMIEGQVVQDFTPRWSINFRYGETLARNEYGLEGSLYHLKLITRF